MGLKAGLGAAPRVLFPPLLSDIPTTFFVLLQGGLVPNKISGVGTNFGLLVPSMICTIVQFSVQDCALVEIRRFHHNVTRNIVTLLSSFLASMVECMGLSPG
jgi:hypothetical protein